MIIPLNPSQEQTRLGYCWFTGVFPFHYPLTQTKRVNQEGICRHYFCYYNSYYNNNSNNNMCCGCHCNRLMWHCSVFLNCLSGWDMQKRTKSVSGCFKESRTRQDWIHFKSDEMYTWKGCLPSPKPARHIVIPMIQSMVRKVNVGLRFHQEQDQTH